MNKHFSRFPSLTLLDVVYSDVMTWVCKESSCTLRQHLFVFYVRHIRYYIYLPIKIT
jgi:hypothetical protein